MYGVLWVVVADIWLRWNMRYSNLNILGYIRFFFVFDELLFALDQSISISLSLSTHTHTHTHTHKLNELITLTHTHKTAISGWRRRLGISDSSWGTLWNSQLRWGHYGPYLLRDSGCGGLRMWSVRRFQGKSMAQWWRWFFTVDRSWSL